MSEFESPAAPSRRETRLASRRPWKRTAVVGGAVCLLIGGGWALWSSANDAPKTPDVAVLSWADEVYGDFAPVTLTGTGPGDVDVPKGIGAAVLTFTHDDGGAFSVRPVSAAEADRNTNADPDVESVETTIPFIAGGLTGEGPGPATGIWGVDVADQADASVFRVDAAGAWTLVVSPVRGLPALPEHGSGDGLYLYGGDYKDVVLDKSGDGEFIVTEFSTDIAQPLIAAEEDAPKAVKLMEGPTIIQVQATDSWSAAPEKD